MLTTAAFTPRRAGQLAGVGGDRIGQWARHRLIRASVYHGRPENRYALADVAEATVVHWLLDRGFDLREIHSAVEHAGGGWPLSAPSLGVARETGRDRGVIALRTVDGEYVEVGRPGDQEVLRPSVFDQVADTVRSGGWFARELGLTRLEVDPARLGGAPCLRGRRWPVERVARIAADPGGRALLVEEYGLLDDEINEAISWTRATAAL